MLKNKDNFFETNIIIPNINKKRNSKFLKRHEIVHLIVDISLLVVKCAFRIRFNGNPLFTIFFKFALTFIFFFAIIVNVLFKIKIKCRYSLVVKRDLAKV